MRTMALALARSRRTDLLVLHEGRREARRVLAAGSKSFALAGLLLGKRARDDAAVLYAWCRRADDVIDSATGADGERALRRLERELDALYAGVTQAPLDAALSELILRRHIPRDYFQALLDGFAMDARGANYPTLDELDLYGFRVAGVVGLMMCHVLGIRDERCLRAAARLGMAMQLTNIARDVVEDADRGRQYLPSELAAPGELRAALRNEPASRARVARAVKAILDRAESYYRDGLAGLQDLDSVSAWAIGTAARSYRAIGRILAGRRYDALAGRAVVSLGRKLLCATLAAASVLLRMPGGWLVRKRASFIPRTLVRFSDVQA